MKNVMRHNILFQRSSDQLILASVPSLLSGVAKKDARGFFYVETAIRIYSKPSNPICLICLDLFKDDCQITSSRHLIPTILHLIKVCNLKAFAGDVK